MSYVWTVIVTMAVCGGLAAMEEFAGTEKPSDILFRLALIAGAATFLMYLGAWLL